MNIIEFDNVSKTFHRSGGRQLLRNHLMRILGRKVPDPFYAIKNVSFRIKPGTRLIREWQGKTHEVTVAEGSYEYRGSRYSSLSEIARLITGTKKA